MNEREILVLAAKAAGYPIDGHTHCDWKFTLGGWEWNPLENDGDALRLAVKLHLFVIVEGDQPDDPRRRTLVGHRSIGSKCVAHSGDPYAATRRAITRAAAEIGKQMEVTK